MAKSKRKKVSILVLTEEETGLLIEQLRQRSEAIGETALSPEKDAAVQTLLVKVLDAQRHAK